jgi:hypothetical protein
MYVIRDKFKSQDNFIPTEGELYSWWAFAAQDEITWGEFIKKLNAGETVSLLWATVRPYSPSGASSFKKEVVCKHPNKYKNIISRTLIFWICPDCKKDLGDG